MARKYERQYRDTRERIRKHAEGGVVEYADNHRKDFLPYADLDDADRILEMADAYDEDKLNPSPPEG